jgi:hypothetical protein
MIDDGSQVCFRDLGEHFTNSATSVILSLLLGREASARKLSRRVVLDLLGDPVVPVTGFLLAQAACIVVYVSELAARRCYDIQGEMMSYSVDMVRQLLWIRVRLVLGFCLRAVNTLSFVSATVRY